MKSSRRELDRGRQADADARVPAAPGGQQPRVGEDERDEQQVHLPETEGVADGFEQGEQAGRHGEGEPGAPGHASDDGSRQPAQQQGRRHDAQHDADPDGHGPGDQRHRRHGHRGERRVGEAVVGAGLDVVVDPAALVDPLVDRAVVDADIEEVPVDGDGGEEDRGGHDQTHGHGRPAARSRHGPAGPLHDAARVREVAREYERSREDEDRAPVPESWTIHHRASSASRTPPTASVN